MPSRHGSSPRPFVIAALGASAAVARRPNISQILGALAQRLMTQGCFHVLQLKLLLDADLRTIHLAHILGIVLDLLLLLQWPLLTLLKFNARLINATEIRVGVFFERCNIY